MRVRDGVLTLMVCLHCPMPIPITVPRFRRLQKDVNSEGCQWDGTEFGVIWVNNPSALT